MNIRALILDDDPAALAEAERVVEQWDFADSTILTGSPEEALKIVEEQDCRVVLADLSRSGMTATAFLDQVRRKRPETLRYLASPESTNRDRFKCAMGSHLPIAKPWSLEAIEAAFRRAEGMDRILGKIRMREIVSRIRTLPTLPSNYTRLLAEVRSPNASSQSVGDIIAEDLAISAKLIQLVNSAYFGLQQRISDPAQAVTVLGMNTVHSLALSIKAFARFDKVKPVYHSIDKVWRHSIEVAELAKILAALEGGSPDLASEAYAAALMHDIGKLALAINFDQDYRDVLNQADENNIPRDVAEREFFGCSHAELGGYLLATWGLPMSMVEAVALHHEPGKSDDEALTPLAVVHIADWLVRQRKAEDANGKYKPRLDNAYLERLGLDDHISEWRGLCRKARLPHPDRVPRPASNRPAVARKRCRPKPRKKPPIALWSAIAGAGLAFMWLLAG